MATYTLSSINRDATPGSVPPNVLVAFTDANGQLRNAPLIPHADPDALTDAAIEAMARAAMAAIDAPA